MGCVGCSGRKKVTTNYMKPGGFRFWSRSLLLVHLVLVLPSHAVLLLCKWSSCCTSFSWCWCCLCVGRGCCWTCLTETGSKSEQKSQAIANKIHAPFRSLTLCCRSRCFLLLFLGASVLPPLPRVLAAGPVNRARETREERQDGARCPIHESPLTRRKGDDSEPKRRGKDVVAHEGEGAREEEGGKEFLLSAELPPSP